MRLRCSARAERQGVGELLSLAPPCCYDEQGVQLLWRGGGGAVRARTQCGMTCHGIIIAGLQKSHNTCPLLAIKRAFDLPRDLVKAPAIR
jgi:hypothetical protein